MVVQQLQNLCARRFMQCVRFEPSSLMGRFLLFVCRSGQDGMMCSGHGECYCGVCICSKLVRL